MSTSSSAAARQAQDPGAPFPYAEVEGAEGAEGAASAEEKARRMQAEAHEQGRQLGREQARAELEAEIEKERKQVAAALQRFAAERQSYYQRVEGEVVQLALAVAQKILHRETQLDPRALAGVVRITLEKLDAGTQVNLHVCPKEATDWRHYFACQVELSPPPEVHEDASLGPGECRIETSLGTTQVGFETQLKEIETGLMDLLAERPGANAPGAGRAPEKRG